MDRMAVLALMAGLLAADPGCAGPGAAVSPAGFPRRPIKVVVYTKPGGLIDRTARKFTSVAAKYTDATFVVENVSGAGGIVAIERVLETPADGYTLLACTKSNISKIVATGKDAYLGRLTWLAMLMADPECLITRTRAEINDWSEVVRDARRAAGAQIWLGPARGGLDHIMALKTWDKAGIRAKWVPFQSGGKAKAALLGGQGIVYVGNPGDVRTSPDELKVAVVSSPVRLRQFPATPTFREVGIGGLDHEVMWRGFAVRRGTPPGALAWYDRLFRQVTADRQWRSYWQRDGINVCYLGPDQFTTVVQQDRLEFHHYLDQLGTVRTPTAVAAAPGQIFLVAALILAAILAAAGVLRRRRLESRFSALLIPTIFLVVSILLLAATFRFPPSAEVGAAAVPRLWLACCIPLSTLLLWDVLAHGNSFTTSAAGTRRAWQMALYLAGYVAGVYYLGYWFSTFAFLWLAMGMLGAPRPPVRLAVATGWLLVSYGVFVRLLYVPLPAGRCWAYFF